MYPYHRYKVQYGTFAQRGLVRVPGLPRPIKLPYGHSFADPPAALLVCVDGDHTANRILALDEADSRIAQIWPPYEKCVIFHSEELLVRVASSAPEIAVARDFLLRIHDKGAAPHGMLVCLYALAEDGGTQSLVGVAQIGEYYHTAFPGRAAFGSRIIGPRYRCLKRGQVIKAVPIAAAKRFAVAVGRQGQGLGRLLALETLKVARNYRWPSAGVVEVSRRLPERKYFALCRNLDSDFLIRSGYVPVPPRNWMRNGQMDDRTAAKLTDRAVSGYYYADLTGAGRPAFLVRALTDRASSVVCPAGD